jgi:predicted nucleic acid-binding protein
MRPNGTVLIDTGFWLALYDGRDPYHRAASGKSEVIDKAHLAVPWPTLYETVNTRFCKNSSGMAQFDLLLRESRTTLIDDTPYREDALRATVVRETRRPPRLISLVDMIMRFILDDVNVRIDALLTFDESGFYDVCRRRRIEIL